MSNTSVLSNYKAELEFALELQEDGMSTVSASVAGKELAKGRDRVPIEEYIKMWQDGVDAMENGTDPELYRY